MGGGEGRVGLEVWGGVSVYAEGELCLSGAMLEWVLFLSGAMGGMGWIRGRGREGMDEREEGK